MKTNPDDKLKTIFEIEHELKIKGKKSIDKTTPLRASRGWAWIQKGATSKQVSKDKVNAFVADGWKLLNK